MKRIEWGTNKYAPKTALETKTLTPDFIRKTQIGMSAILEYRLSKGIPLKIMRPLVYTTSIMDTQNNEDDGFYKVRKSMSMEKFVDINITIPVGTELLLKSIDLGVNEFIFVEKGTKVEHAISFEYKNHLMNNTDIFETVKKHLEASN